MNSPDLLAPWLAPLGWLALEAALVVLAALAVQPLLRTAAARRSLWRAVLLALIVILALELTGTGSQLPAQLRLAWQTTFPAPVPPPEPPPPLEELPFTPPPIFSLAPTGGEARREGAFPAPEPLQLEPASPLPPPPRTLSHSPTFSPAPSPLPAFLWLTGLAALLARAAWTHAGFAWLRLRHFLPAAEALCERVQALAARLGLRRRVRVLASERLHAPAAFGWVRPGVGVPGDFTARFAPAQQDVMLAHELAHLAARDPLWQLLADLAVAALWWHPLAWVARHQHRLAAELAADDASQALPDGPVVLAECLLVLGQEAAAAPRAPLGMAGFRSQLGRRVERLVALPRRDWSAPGPLRLALQTTTALLALAALALLPGCAANRSASEAPSHLVTKWWQAKKSSVGDDVRSLHSKPERGTSSAETSQRLAISSPTNTQPVVLQGRVRFNGTPPPEREIPLPPTVGASMAARAKELDEQRKVMLAELQRAAEEFKQLVESATDFKIAIPERERRKQAAEAKLRELQKLETRIGEFDRNARSQFSAARTNGILKTRFHRVAPDGGLADVLVYVKEGLTNQNFAAPTNAFVVLADHYEFQPYIGAVQAGQPIRWESVETGVLNLNPTPTNRDNREFSYMLSTNRPIEAKFAGPELFLRVKADVFPWMFHYVSVLPHPFFAVTDAEGRFRFPQPLPPGKYTLAAVHRQTGEAVRELDLTQSAPAGQPPEIEFVLSPKVFPPYRVAAGDELSVAVYKRDDLRTRGKVQPDGTLTLPLIGAVSVAGKTISEVRNAIRDAYQPAHMAEAHITVSLVQSAPRLAPPPLLSTPKQASDFRPAKPPTWDELFDRKVRVEAEIKEAEKRYKPSHPKLHGLLRQLETVERAFKETPPAPHSLLLLQRRLTELDAIETKLQNPALSPAERLTLYASAGGFEPSTGEPSVQPRNGEVTVSSVESWQESERAKLPLERTIKELSQTYRPSHPKMQTLYRQLEALKRRQEEEVRTASAKFDLLKRTLQQQQRELLEQQGATLPPAPVGDDVRSLTPTQTRIIPGSEAPTTVLAAGDSVRIQISYLQNGTNQSLAYRGEIAPAGYVPIPRASKAVFIAGKTVEEGARLIREQLVRDGLESPRVTLDMAVPLPVAPPGTVFRRPTDTYRIHAGDELIVSVWGRDDLRTKGKVQSDGRMTLPLVEAVPVAGSTLSDARAAIKAAYQPAHLAEAHVAVQLIRSVQPPTNGMAALSYPTLPDLVVLHPLTLERLAKVRLPEVSFNAVSLPAVLQQLNADTLRLDPGQDGIKFEVQKGLFTATAFDPPPSSDPVKYTNASGAVVSVKMNGSPSRSRVRLNFDMDTVSVSLPSALRGVAVLDALEAIVTGADYPIRYTIETNRVIFWQRHTDEPSPAPKPPAPKPGASAPAPSPFAERGEKVAEGRLRGAATNADAANPSPQPSPLSAKREREQTPPVGDDVRSLTPTRSAETRTRNEEASQSLVTSSPTNATPLHHQPSVEKLARIRLPEVTYDGLPLSEVLKFLQADAKKFDPDKAGVEFGMRNTNSTAELLELFANAPPATDGVVRNSAVVSNATLSATIPLPRTRVRQVVRTDMDTALVHLPTILRDVSVLDALDAIVKTANTPIGYTVEPNRVVFRPRVPGHEFVSPRVGAAVRGASVRAQTEKIVFPSVIFDGLPLPEVVKFLIADARRHDPERRSLNVILTSHYPDPPGALDQPAEPLLDRLGNPIPHTPLLAHPDLGVVLVRLAPARQNLTFRQTLDAICAHTDAGLQNGIGLTYRFEDYGVVITPKFPAPPAPKPAASAPPASQRLVTSSPTPVQLAAASPKGVTLPVPNPYFRTNSQVPFLTHSSKGAQGINRKLDQIVLPEVHFDAVPLVGVVQRLIEDAKKFDPEPDPAKKGLNFLINDVAPAAPLLDAAGNPVPVARPVALSEGLVRVTQPLKNLTLRQALDVICKTAELPTQFSVEEYAIAFIPRGPVAYYSRTFRVNPDTFIQGLQGVVGNPVLGVTPGVGNAPGAAGQNQPTITSAAPVRATVPATVPATQRTAAEANALVRQFFQSAGVTALGAPNGSTRVTFNPANGLLQVRGTTNDLRLIEQAIQKVQPSTTSPPPSGPESRAPERDRPGRSGPVSTNAVPKANYQDTNTVIPSVIRRITNAPSAQRINAKLDQIILPELRFDSETLPEVVKWLDANARKSDPERRGLNFLINNVMSDYISQNPESKPTAPLLDPRGNPITANPRPAPALPDMGAALVKLPVAVPNLTLRQALDAICKATTVKLPDGRSTALKYSAEGYAIVFSPKLPEQAALFSRIFKVDPERFITGLRNVVDEKQFKPGTRAALEQALREKTWTNAPAGTNGFSLAGMPVAKVVIGVANTNVTSELNHLVRHYLTAAGVASLGVTNGPAATQVFFNDRNGLLLVRASLQDLDIIQQAIELLNAMPPAGRK